MNTAEIAARLSRARSKPAPKTETKPLSDAAKQMMASGDYDFESEVFVELCEHLKAKGYQATQHQLLRTTEMFGASIDALAASVGKKLDAHGQKINKLEAALKHALEAVESDITTDIGNFLDDDDGEPSLADLERRAADHKKRMEKI